MHRLIWVAILINKWFYYSEALEILIENCITCIYYSEIPLNLSHHMNSIIEAFCGNYENQCNSLSCTELGRLQRNDDVCLHIYSKNSEKFKIKRVLFTCPTFSPQEFGSKYFIVRIRVENSTDSGLFQVYKSCLFKMLCNSWRYNEQIVHAKIYIVYGNRCIIR